MVKTQSPVTHWDENVKCMRSPLPVETGVSLLFLFLCVCMHFRVCWASGEMNGPRWFGPYEDLKHLSFSQRRSTRGLPWDALTCLRPLYFGAPCSCPSRNHCPSCSALAAFHLPESQACGEAQVLPRDFYSLTILGLPQGVPCMALKCSHWLL